MTAFDLLVQVIHWLNWSSELIRAKTSIRAIHAIRATQMSGANDGTKAPSAEQ